MEVPIVHYRPTIRRCLVFCMNRPLGVPALAGPDRLKAGLQTSGVPTDQFMVPMHGLKVVWALHEPYPPHPILLPQWGRR